LFVALEIPAAVRDNLARLMSELRATDSASATHTARWVRPGNLHVTLKFIGHVEAAKLDAIHAALGEIRADKPIDLVFRGVGFFPNEKRARVFWAGIDAGPHLAGLADDLDARLASLEIARETRGFVPHLTLARFDPPGISEKLRAAVAENSAREFGSLRTHEFHLIESKTLPAGAQYTRLASFSFVAEA
jgi:2'-5' RNA ligase